MWYYCRSSSLPPSRRPGGRRLLQQAELGLQERLHALPARQPQAHDPTLPRNVDPEVEERAATRLEAGFTLKEIRQLVTEFGANRWRRLAERKLAEIQTARQRLRAMTVLLEKLLECECPDIEFCGRAIERSAVAGGRRIRRTAKTARD